MGTKRSKQLPYDQQPSNQLRRRFLRTGIFCGITLTSGVFISRYALATTARAPDDDSLALSVLIAALRSAGTSVCLRQADKLEASQARHGNYDLHLRQAGLSFRQGQSIATAIRVVLSQPGADLRSFSMSYNPGLGDAGALALALALPITVTEIGLVRCAIGDKGGEALLSWALRALELQVICVEGNKFSRNLRLKFSAFGRQQSGPLVIV